jgi:hypothetical protein
MIGTAGTNRITTTKNVRVAINLRSLLVPLPHCSREPHHYDADGVTIASGIPAVPFFASCSHSSEGSDLVQFLCQFF